MNWPKRDAAWLALILLIALAGRVAAGVAWQRRLPDGTRFAFGDSDGYWQLADQLARGAAYTYPTKEFRVFRAPGYPLLLAPLMRVAQGEPPLWLARTYTALLATIGIGGVYWLGRQIQGSTVGLIAAAIVAISPEQVAIGPLILSDAPFCALVPYQLAAWVKALRVHESRPRAAWFFLAGAIGGAAALIRPSWLLFAPFAIGIWLLACRDRRRHALDSVWILLGTVLLMSPWWVRNWQVTGHFVPTTLQVGASLYDGLNPQATGASNMQPGDEAAEQFAEHWQHAAANPVPAAEKQGDYEYQLDRYLRQLAMNWTLEHPGRAWQLAGVKLWRFWNIWPNEPQFRQPVVRAIVFAGYAPLICLAVYGGWRRRQRGWPTALLVLPAVYLSLLHMIFVSSIRYRQGAMISLSVLAAAALVELWQRRKRT